MAKNCPVCLNIIKVVDGGLEFRGNIVIKPEGVKGICKKHQRDTQPKQSEEHNEDQDRK